MAVENTAAAGIPTSSADERAPGRLRIGRYQGWLIVLFLLSLPLVNPFVHGDGVGYYAYARALLIEHRLDFVPDWKHANESFVKGRTGLDGRLLPDQYTATGHVENLWTIGPSLLWLPFLAVTHGGVLLADHFGAHVAADGFSAPYRVTMALATCFYGFFGLLIAFSLGREYFRERWAFLATLGIWFASSLFVYMYFNPSWSHALSAFVVALFFWYWHRTREQRSPRQWVLLGLASGLMVDVYYPNGSFLVLPLLEAFEHYAGTWKSPIERFAASTRLLRSHALFVSAFVIGLLPTFISRSVIFGSPLRTGYYSARAWKWTSPALWSVLWSSDHGLLSWTPILILALVGLFLFRRVDRSFANKLIICCVAFYVLIAFYPDWDGLSSFGNRFFISLTPIFVLGLAAFFDWLAKVWTVRRAFALSGALTALLILWNFGMMYQWGMHLIPVRGPISWRKAAHNQVAVVPSHLARDVRHYVLSRSSLMRHIEDEDVRQLKAHSN